MARTVNITNQTARLVSEYIRNNIACSRNQANAINEFMQENKLNLQSADPELYSMITDLMTEYCEDHNLELEQLYINGYNEDYFFHAVTTPHVRD